MEMIIAINKLEISHRTLLLFLYKLKDWLYIYKDVWEIVIMMLEIMPGRQTIIGSIHTFIRISFLPVLVPGMMCFMITFHSDKAYWSKHSMLNIRVVTFAGTECY